MKRRMSSPATVAELFRDTMAGLVSGVAVLTTRRIKMFVEITADEMTPSAFTRGRIRCNQSAPVSSKPVVPLSLLDQSMMSR